MKFIRNATYMSFPLVGNLSSEGFWTSQNDRKKTSKSLFTYELFSKSLNPSNPWPLEPYSINL